MIGSFSSELNSSEWRGLPASCPDSYWIAIEIAFGETFVEEHSNTDRTPYLFNGKELDACPSVAIAKAGGDGVVLLRGEVL